MAKKTQKFRVAIVAEFESELNLTLLASNLNISCLDKYGVNKVVNVKLETFQLEELDYKNVKLEKLL